jgi:hypothetical protein
MPLVAKRFRHVAVAIPEVRVRRGVALSPLTRQVHVDERYIAQAVSPADDSQKAFDRAITLAKPYGTRPTMSSMAELIPMAATSNSTKAPPV